MELRHLRYFIAVAEEQNVTRAAARLNVSQPPLSRQVRDLEAELGVALFKHGAKSVRLTDAGRVFLNEARAVLQRAGQAVQTVKAAASGQSGEIHVGYAPSLTVDILPRALRCFQEGNPNVRVQLHDLSTREMLRGLREGELHVALLVQVSGKSFAGLSFTELHQFAGCVAVPPAHRLARARRISVDQIAAEPLVAFTVADYPEYHIWMNKLFAPLKRLPVIREEHDSVSSLIAAVEAGRGLAFVLEPFQCFAPRIKVCSLISSTRALSMGVVRRADDDSPLTGNFIAAVKNAPASGAARRSGRSGAKVAAGAF